MVCMGEDAERSAHDRAAELARQRDELFTALARTAEAVARAEEERVDVHDSAAGLLTGAVEHAVRGRRFAEAERAAAAAYREHRLPPDEVRQVIRDPRGPAPTGRPSNSEGQQPSEVDKPPAAG